MARMPYADLARAHPKLRETYESLPAKLNLFRMLAHAERNFRPLLELGGTILSRQRLDAKLRERAILYVAQLSLARYEWVQHVPIALRKRLGDPEVIELTLAIGYYMMMARMMEATGVDLDEAAGVSIVAGLEEADREEA